MNESARNLCTPPLPAPPPGFRILAAHGTRPAARAMTRGARGSALSLRSPRARAVAILRGGGRRRSWPALLRRSPRRQRAGEPDGLPPPWPPVGERGAPGAERWCASISSRERAAASSCTRCCCAYRRGRERAAPESRSRAPHGVGGEQRCEEGDKCCPGRCVSRHGQNSDPRSSMHIFVVSNRKFRIIQSIFF